MAAADLSAKRLEKSENSRGAVSKPEKKKDAPSYEQLGLRPRDLFGSGYYSGVLALNVKTSSDKVEMSTTWQENLEENKLSGTVTAKYYLTDYNVVFTEKLDKNSFLNTEICYKDKLLKGLSLTLGAAFSPRTGVKIGLLKSKWSNRFCFVDSELVIEKELPAITSSWVLCRGGIFGGMQWKYDLNKLRAKDLNFTLGYSNEYYYVYTYVNNGSECGGSLCHKVSPELDVGVDIKWWTKSPDLVFGVAAKYQVNQDVSVKGKINNNSELGLSYQQRLGDGIKLTISTLFNLQSLDAGPRFGLGLQSEL